MCNTQVYGYLTDRIENIIFPLPKLGVGSWLKMIELVEFENYV